MVKQKILGLDLGSNSIGWALLEGEDGIPKGIIDAGCRIFNKAVEDKTPTPKNVERRKKRLARRVTQRRARRKKRMRNYLIKLGLLPETLKDSPQPEIILNNLGNPYQLRAKALDKKLRKYEVGRVFFHLVQRRGFLSSKKTLLGDMADDPDVLAILREEDPSFDASKKNKEESAFKDDINKFRKTIQASGSRTLGEYLSRRDHHDCKRNRRREGGQLRTDRQMYRDELSLIWAAQCKYHDILNDKVKQEIEHIIFYQRPLKLKAGRQGNCSLEPRKKRARMGRLEVQKFRYLQDINNLQYRFPGESEKISLNETQRTRVIDLFERVLEPSFAKIRTTLKLPKDIIFNLESDIIFNLESDIKKLKGNTTAIKIRKILPEWDDWPVENQYALVEDLITINKKSVLRKRLMSDKDEHWNLPFKTAVKLCLIELEPGHANLSSKAIKKLLPYMEQGQIYSDARRRCGYGSESKNLKKTDRLGPPPYIPNPIVSKGLHELRRVINAIIAHHGTPDAIRIEMARDLEMNTQKYKRFKKQQEENTKANDEAIKKYKEMRLQNKHLHLSEYPNKDDKIRYRLWKDQDQRCAYSNECISSASLFSPDIEIDHIIPYSKSLDDSYMNKVVCFTKENRYKGAKTPIDAFGGNKEKWDQIIQAIGKWGKSLGSKQNRFFMTADEVQKRDFISTQLNDTRYISKQALTYLKQLGSDISVTKGFLVAWMRRQWGLNSLIGETNQKERTDHRHHTIDAIVIACIDRKFHHQLVRAAKVADKNHIELKTKHLMENAPWETLRRDAGRVIDQIIVTHTPLKKISGALHKDTGAGLLEKAGTVYRQELGANFTSKKAKNIIDPKVKKIVSDHLSNYNNEPKDAFAQGIVVYHADGKTPIKRVRLYQAKTKTSVSQLMKDKLGIKNRQGDIFKWMPYGNIHHVEIIKNKKTGLFSGDFVTMLEARRRALTQTRQAQKKRIQAEPVIKIDHGRENTFIMALHKNDLVQLEVQTHKFVYRVQKLDKSNKRINLILHTTAKPKPTCEFDTVKNGEATIPALMAQKMRPIKLNVLGKPFDD